MITISNMLNNYIERWENQMSSKTRGGAKGFTIIEVVLVLAIAALIFLMVFIALPALQRGQRDTARKQDANTVVTALNTWKGNHRGSMPDFNGGGSDTATFLNDYVKNLGQYDVSDSNSFIVNGDDTSSELSTDKIQIAPGAQCKDDGSSFTAHTSSRSAAVLIKLEASSAVVCIDA